MKNYLILGFLLICFLAQGQEVLTLSIDQVIAKCKNASFELKRQQLKQSLAEAKLNKAKEWWLPEVFVGTTFHHLDGNAMNGNGFIFTEVDRQNRWYGGELNFNWDFADGLYGVKAKKLAAESVALNNEVGQNLTIVQAITEYYAVLIAEMELDIYEELIFDKSALIDQLAVQVNAGLRLESELLLAKSNLQRLKLKAVSSYQAHSEATSRLLNTLNVNKAVGIQGSMEDLKMIELVSLEELDSYNKASHPAVKAGELMIAAQEKEAALTSKGYQLPKAGIRYNYGLFGAEYSDTQTTRGLQGFLGWTIPLGQIFMNGEGKAAEVKLQLAALDLEEQTLGLSQQLNNYKYQLIKIKTLLDLSSEGGSYAKQALDQALIRQREGIASSYEVILAQEEYIQARLMHLRMVANYNLLQYKLMVAIGKRI